MGMRDAILNFPKQFEYEPKIENADKFRPGKKFIVCGMGGSHLAAMIFNTVKPEVFVKIHSDYDLPAWLSGDELVVISSYSGNTEEPLDAFEKARERKLPMIAISVGGRLLDLAKKYGVPYIQLPDTGIQPRSAVGFSFRAMLKVFREEKLLAESEKLVVFLSPADFEERGRNLAEKISGFVPIIYSSARNYSIAYSWKIKFNETGKIPAFCNVVPELNHNEMNGFDRADSTRTLSEKFYFIFLKDTSDEPKIRKRMSVLEKLYKGRGLQMENVEMNGDSELSKIFSSFVLADWASFHLASRYGVEPEQVPMVEEFKKLIA